MEYVSNLGAQKVVMDRYSSAGLTQHVRIAYPSLFWPRLRIRHAVNHGQRIPVGIQVVVSSLEWSHRRP
jgi:hypothetical protein